MTLDPPGQRMDSYDQLEERASFAYEAIATAKGMVSKTPGVGSGYFSAYQDADGEWLDGGKTYHLRVSPNPPVKQFWSVTIYNTDNRTFVQNKAKRAEIGSRSTDLEQNTDGSVDLYFGPKAPEGFESNWLQINPGEGWFAIFRFYAPTEPYLERTWFLLAIEKVK